MNPIKKILVKAVQQYGEYDPTIWIPYYFRQQRQKKTIATQPTSLSGDVKQRIKNLWGKYSWWFEFYNAIGEKDKAHFYFPDPWFIKYIDATENDWKVCTAVDDKCFYDYYFADVNRPQTVVKVCNGFILDEASRVISLKDAVKLCKEAQGVIIKPSVNSDGGKGIVFWREGGDVDIEDLLKDCKNVVVQCLIEQHPTLAAIHPDSVNSIRIMTLTEGNQVKDLSSILRMGVGKSQVDNVSSGGVAVGIDEKGILKRKSFSGDGKCYEGHPDGVVLEGINVPSYFECLEICSDIAPRFARFSRLISWDFAIGADNKPSLIEANLRWGELDFHQMCNGPIFKDEETTKRMIQKYMR